MDDFYIWVNEQIVRFRINLQNKCISSRQFMIYKDKFSTYCAECISKYEERLELESQLKYEIVRESIKLIKNIEYSSAL